MYTVKFIRTFYETVNPPRVRFTFGGQDGAVEGGGRFRVDPHRRRMRASIVPGARLIAGAGWEHGDAI